MVQTPNSILALDVGEKRVGLAVASLEARLPHPLTTIRRGDSFWQELQGIVNTEQVIELVVGLPRGMAGQETEQTHKVKTFGVELSEHLDLPIHFQDEAATSVKAEAELEARGQPYQRGDIDALAATYILDDYLSEHLSQETV